MARFLTLSDVDVAGKTVLVRADLNVPMSEGRVTDATRLERLVPGPFQLGFSAGRLGRVRNAKILELTVGPIVGDGVAARVEFLVVV